MRGYLSVNQISEAIFFLATERTKSLSQEDTSTANNEMKQASSDDIVTLSILERISQYFIHI